MRAFVDGLWGTHRFEAPAGSRNSGDCGEAIGNRPTISEHPLVRVHSETGEFRPHWNTGMISRAKVRIMPKNEASSAAKQRRFMASTPALR